MNSTERLLACIAGQPTDRVPISTYELVGRDSKAWENNEPSYARLMDYIRRHTDCLYMCGVSTGNAAAKEWNTTVEKWDEGDQHVRRETIHCPGGRKLTRTFSHSDNVKTTWQREHPVKDLDDLQAYLDLPWRLGEPDFSRLQRAWDELDGQWGLPMVSMADPLCELAEAFEFSNFTIHAMTETDAIVAALDRLHERYMARYKAALTGPVKNVVFRICGPEYATPPYLPPALFEKFVVRYDSHYVGMIQQAGGFARIHSHGKIGRVADLIAGMGPDALDPVEPPPDGDITIAELKRSLGQKICLMGGIELKHLEAGSEQFVRQLVADIMRQGKPGGRFVIMPTAAPINIPLSSQTEANYMHFIDAALEAGKY